MYRALFLMFLMLWVSSVASARPDEEGDDAVDQLSVEQQFQEIEGDYNAAMGKFRAAYNEAMQKAANLDEAARRRAVQVVYQQDYPNMREYAARHLKLAESHPDDPAAVKSLAWIMRRVNGSPESKQAVGLLAKNHVESDQLLPVMLTLTRSYPSDEVEDFLRSVAAKNPDGDTQGMAKYALGKYLASLVEIRRTLASEVDKVATYKSRFGEQLVTRLMDRQVEDLESEIEALFEEVAAKHGDVSYGRSKLADIVEGDLFEIKYLAIGKVAPDIEGEDLDGVPFKLSDYRGKVVVIDFWGDW